MPTNPTLSRALTDVGIGLAGDGVHVTTDPLVRALERLIGEPRWDGAADRPVSLWSKLEDVLTRLERLERLPAGLFADIEPDRGIVEALVGKDEADRLLGPLEVDVDLDGDVTMTPTEPTPARQRVAITLKNHANRDHDQSLVCDVGTDLTLSIGLLELFTLHFDRVDVEPDGGARIPGTDALSPRVVVNGVTYTRDLDQRRLLAEAGRLLSRYAGTGPAVRPGEADALADRIQAHLDPL